METQNSKITADDFDQKFSDKRIRDAYIIEQGQLLKVSSELKQLYIVLILLCLAVCPVSARYCTVLRSRSKVETLTKYEPCIQSYNTSCSWFSSEQCTFYEHAMCKKTFNQTRTFYSIVTECCPGFTMMKNRTCKKSTEDISTEEDNAIEHGVFAGIGCGAVFIICVTILIVLHLKKNEKKKIIMNQCNVKMKDEQVKILTNETLENGSDVMKDQKVKELTDDTPENGSDVIKEQSEKLLNEKHPESASDLNESTA